MKLKCDNHTIDKAALILEEIMSVTKWKFPSALTEKDYQINFFRLYHLIATKLVQYFIRIYPITLALKCDMSYFNINIGAHTNEYLLLS